MVEKTKKACLSLFNLLTIVLVCALGCFFVALAFVIKITLSLLGLIRGNHEMSYAPATTHAARPTNLELRRFEAAPVPIAQDKKAS